MLFKLEIGYSETKFIEKFHKKIINYFLEYKLKSGINAKDRINYLVDEFNKNKIEFQEFNNSMFNEFDDIIKKIYYITMRKIINKSVYIKFKISKKEFKILHLFLTALVYSLYKESVNTKITVYKCDLRHPNRLTINQPNLYLNVRKNIDIIMYIYEKSIKYNTITIHNRNTAIFHKIKNIGISQSYYIEKPINNYKDKCFNRNCTDQNCIINNYHVYQKYKNIKYKNINYYDSFIIGSNAFGGSSANICLKYHEEQIFMKYYNLTMFILYNKYNNDTLLNVLFNNLKNKHCPNTFNFSDHMRNHIYKNSENMHNININLPMSKTLINLLENKILKLNKNDKLKIIKIIYVFKYYMSIIFNKMGYINYNEYFQNKLISMVITII